MECLIDFFQMACVHSLAFVSNTRILICIVSYFDQHGLWNVGPESN